MLIGENVSYRKCYSKSLLAPNNKFVGDCQLWVVIFFKVELMVANQILGGGDTPGQYLETPLPLQAFKMNTTVEYSIHFNYLAY